jgi:hypothetical protein
MLLQLWFRGTPNTLVGSQAHYDFTVGYEGIVYFYFEAREDAAGAITLSTAQS